MGTTFFAPIISHVTQARMLLWCLYIIIIIFIFNGIKQLSDEVEHDIMNYQNQGLCYLPKPNAEADNTDTRF